MRKSKKNRDRIRMDYWQSYSDVMAALLLVFILIVFASIQKLKMQENQLAKQKERVEKQRIELEIQKANAKESQNELDELKKKISKVIGVKAEIIEELKKELNDENLKIDEQTGAIQFSSEILFDKDKYNLKNSGKKQLDQFLNSYFHVLLHKKFIDNIAEIIIEGHADTDGGYDYNMKLSQNRAYTVANYCLNNQKLDLTKKQREYLRSIITANGRSSSNPILNSDNSENKKQSRRVVFQFLLKDEEMIEELEEILLQK